MSKKIFILIPAVLVIAISAILCFSKVEIPEVFASPLFPEKEESFTIPTMYERFQVKSGEIILPEDVPNCTFKIDIENKNHEYRVILKSPTGQELSTENRGIKLEGGYYSIFIPLAEQGTWTCEVTGFEIGKVRVEAGESREYLSISSFTYNKDREEVKVQVKDAMGRYDCEVFAVNASGKAPVLGFSSEEAKSSASLPKESLPEGTMYLELKVTDITGVPDSEILYL